MSDANRAAHSAESAVFYLSFSETELRDDDQNTAKRSSQESCTGQHHGPQPTRIASREAILRAERRRVLHFPPRNTFLIPDDTKFS